MSRPVRAEARDFTSRDPACHSRHAARNISTKRPLRAAATVLIAWAGLFATTSALAGTEGHEVVALVAERLLTPEVAKRVGVILALEPGATLASVSNWADQTRTRSTAPWHYVNLAREQGSIPMVTS